LQTSHWHHRKIFLKQSLASKGNISIEKILWSQDYAAKLTKIYKAEIGKEKG